MPAEYREKYLMQVICIENILYSKDSIYAETDANFLETYIG